LLLALLRFGADVPACRSDLYDTLSTFFDLPHINIDPYEIQKNHKSLFTIIVEDISLGLHTLRNSASHMLQRLLGLDPVLVLSLCVPVGSAGGCTPLFAQFGQYMLDEIDASICTVHARRIADTTDVARIDYLLRPTFDVLCRAALSAPSAILSGEILGRFLQMKCWALASNLIVADGPVEVENAVEVLYVRDLIRKLLTASLEWLGLLMSALNVVSVVHPVALWVKHNRSLIHFALSSSASLQQRSITTASLSLLEETTRFLCILSDTQLSAECRYLTTAFGLPSIALTLIRGDFRTRQCFVPHTENNPDAIAALNKGVQRQGPSQAQLLHMYRSVSYLAVFLLHTETSDPQVQRADLPPWTTADEALSTLVYLLHETVGALHDTRHFSGHKHALALLVCCHSIGQILLMTISSSMQHRQMLQQRLGYFNDLTGQLVDWSTKFQSGRLASPAGQANTVVDAPSKDLQLVNAEATEHAPVPPVSTEVGALLHKCRATMSAIVRKLGPQNGRATINMGA